MSSSAGNWPCECMTQLPYTHRADHLKYVTCLDYFYTCKYVHTSSCELAGTQRANSVATAARKKNNGERWSKRNDGRQAWQATQVQDLFPSSVFSTSWQLVAMICFCLSYKDRRHFKKPQRSHTPGSSFSSRLLLLCPAWQTEVHFPSRGFTSHYRTPWFLLGIGNRKKEGGGKYNKNTVSGVKRLGAPEVNTNMRRKEPGPR